MEHSILPKPVRHLVLIDDDSVALRAFTDQMGDEGYLVTQKRDADEFVQWIGQEKLPEVDFFVVDLMMPVGDVYDLVKTQGGLLTGLFVARDIRTRFSDIPILLWSVGIFPDVVAKAEELASSLPNCAFVQKIGFTPRELVAFIDRYFEDNRFRSTFFRTLWDSLKLEPSIYGMGINLKKLRKRK